MKGKYLFIAIIAVLSGCATQRRCFEKFPPQVITKDSIIQKDTTIYRDTTITIPGDTVIIEDSIPCPGVNIFRSLGSKNGRTTASVSIKDNRLRVDCKTDSLNMVIKNLTTKIKSLEKYHSEVKIIQAPPKIKYRIPALFWWLLFLNIGYVGYRLWKIYKKYSP